MQAWKLQTIAFIFCVTSCVAQQPNKTTTPHFNLQSGGRACTGYMRVNAKQFVWKTFSRCDTGYRVISHDGDNWILKLERTDVQRKSCPFNIVGIRKLDPDNVESNWEVAGFDSLETLQQHPELSILGCGMQ
jgi:hypothetical protein